MQESAETPPPIRRAVVLLHTLPDASSHHDLLLERPHQTTGSASDPDDRRLIAFRVAPPPHNPETCSAEATRLPDHRARYLEYQGPLTANRGDVTRLATATLTKLIESPDAIVARIAYLHAICDLTGRRLSRDRWRLSLEWSPVG